MRRITLLTIMLLGMALLAGCGSSNQPLPPTSIPLQNPSPGEPASPGLIPPQHPLVLPEGFHVNVYAADLQGPRMLAFGPDQMLYVTESATGRVLRLPDRDGDHTADGAELVANDLINPSGLVFHQDGSLYVAETTRVFRLQDPDGDGFYQELETVVAGIAAGGNTNRTLIFSPTGDRLFLAIGSSCNACQEQDPRRAAVMRFNPDGSDGRIFARGLRYVIGLAFDPRNDILWAAVIERDGLSAGLPPETIYALFQDADGGWPYCHAGRITDPDFGRKDSCSQGLLAPQYELEAHTAPSGIEFYTGSQFPDEYQNDLFIALHGSGTGDSAAGFKIIRIPLGSGDQGIVQDFAVGWLLEDGSSWGTPLDLAQGPDGSLYLSDDSAGMIYRIYYQE